MTQVTVTHLTFRNLPPRPKLKRRVKLNLNQSKKKKKSKHSKRRKATVNPHLNPQKNKSIILSPWVFQETNALLPSEQPSEMEKEQLNTSSTVFLKIHLHKEVHLLHNFFRIFKIFHNSNNSELLFKMIPTPFLKYLPKSLNHLPNFTM